VRRCGWHADNITVGKSTTATLGHLVHIDIGNVKTKIQTNTIIPVLMTNPIAKSCYMTLMQQTDNTY